MATPKYREVSKSKRESDKSDAKEPYIISERKTEMYIKFAKIMLMYQGPYPDSRSREIEKLKSIYNYASKVISDETYRQHRKTTCAYDRTEEFYEYFRVEALRGLEEGNNLVVLDPTMSNTKQNRFYLALAYKMQYVFLLRPPVVSKSTNPAWPHKSQAASFREQKTVIPYSNMFQHLFCAWYLHDIDSHELRHVAKLYVQDCLDGIPEFGKLFDRVCPDLSESLDDVSDDEEYTLEEYRSGKYDRKQSSSGKYDRKQSGKSADPKAADGPPKRCTPDSFARHYHLEDQRQDLAYCVVKIFNGMKDMNEYFQEERIQKIYGKMSRLLVTGFVISPHVVAARIKLTKEQKELWDHQDELDENSKAQFPCASELVKSSKADLPEVNVRLISSKSNQTLIVNSGMVVREPLEAISTHAKGKSCHIVLGSSPGAPGRNIDCDVAFALRRERSSKSEDVEVIDLERCVVKRFGKYWILYLKEMYSVNGFFASCVKPYAYDNAIK